LTEEAVEATGTLKTSSLNCAMKSAGEVIEPKVKDTWFVKQSAPILRDCSNVANLLLYASRWVAMRAWS